MLLAVALVLSCLFSCFFTNTTLTCYASGISVDGGYSGVMQDLMQDGSFNADDYVVDENDHSLQVITIAESKDNELLVYVYQPSANYGNLVATTINISTAYKSKLNFKNYGLTLLNKQGAFYKYLVNNFVVSKDATRVYDVSSIFRAWNEDYDKKADGDNTISEVSFAVGKEFTFTSNNSLSVADTDYITITDKYVGYVRYTGGMSFLGKEDSCDSHFVAFSTDKEIDKLLEADVYFQTQSVYRFDYTHDYKFGKIEDNYSYITDTDTIYYKGQNDFWYNYTYVKDRIQTASDFVKGEDFTNVYKGAIFNVKAEYKMDASAKSIIESQQWVLRFYESDYIETWSGYGPMYDWTNVSNVSILRLKFETNGKVYDLGVIDNKQTGSGMPVNSVEYEWTFSDMFKLIMGILLLILLIVVLSPFIPAIWNFITTPFKVIKKTASKKNKIDKKNKH